ncbi:MAG: PAS domain-containing protein, partial [Ignavibacteriales bacterium]
MERVEHWKAYLQPHNAKPFHAMITVTAVDDSQGKLIGLRWLILDITEQNQVKESLREGEQEYMNLFENVPTGIYRTTPDGRILMANPALIRMLEYSSFEELTSRNLEKEGFATPYLRAQFRELLERE